MTVLLRRSRDLPQPMEYSGWVAIRAVGAAGLDPARRVRNLGVQLEQAFEAIAQDWWALARKIGCETTAWPTHAAAAAPNASDLGLMLAWTQLVDNWSAAADIVLVLCDDPWLFRHLASRPNVRAGSVPGLAAPVCLLLLRGFLSRVATAARAAHDAIRLRSTRRFASRHSPAILVYGHPASNPEGYDAYFGNLMERIPSLVRVLHTDCRGSLALTLSAKGRAVSLHAWGNPWAAVSLIAARWRPSPASRTGAHGWLVRRAAAIENGHGNIAMTRWQDHCQRRWLRSQRPRAVAWPWENHPWERALVRSAVLEDAQTVGYQHSVIGRHMLNYAAHSNPDGLASMPQHVLCTGLTTQRQLAKWGIPASRLAVGGALRFLANPRTRFDPAAAIFVALPFGGTIAAEMIDAARDLAVAGRTVLVKDHPMTPSTFEEGPNLKRTHRPLTEHECVSAVVYAATTVGLEARLAGLPTIRFRSSANIALDILPEGVDVPPTERDTIVADVSQLIERGPAAPLARDGIFAAVESALWTQILGEREIA